MYEIQTLKSIFKKLACVYYETQTEKEINQAKESVSLFYRLVEIHKDKDSQSPQQNKSDPKPAIEKTDKKVTSSKNQSWNEQFKILKDEIQLRLYSPSTLKTYTIWVRKFQAYLKSKSPEFIDSADAKNFITHLAVERQVSASTQNQAFNALLSSSFIPCPEGSEKSCP